MWNWAFRLRFQLRRRAFRYIFACSAYAPLAKDAASIPNAVGLLRFRNMPQKQRLPK